MRPVVLAAAAVSVAGLLAASTGILPVKLVYNASNSAPAGFYWLDRQPVRRGDFVLVRVPEQVRELAMRRRYLPSDIPLIKRVTGAAGDEICRRGKVVSINGKPTATALKFDQHGRRMPQWRGCVRLNDGQVFLLQEHPHSFDGRYFGPVSDELIIGRAARLGFPWRKSEQE